MSFKLPVPQIQTLEDGCVAITFGEFTGVVSSMHLVDVKINQLEVAYRKKYQAGFISE